MADHAGRLGYGWTLAEMWRAAEVRYSSWPVVLSTWRGMAPSWLSPWCLEGVKIPFPSGIAGSSTSSAHFTRWRALGGIVATKAYPFAQLARFRSISDR